MKRLIFITLLFAATVAYAATEQAFVPFQSVEKTGAIAKTTRARNIHRLSGPLAMQANGTCSVFINATTLARTAATTGFPMVANTTYQWNIPKVSSLTFTCASTAGNSNLVYIAR